MPENQQLHCRCGQFYNVSDGQCPGCGLRPRRATNNCTHEATGSYRQIHCRDCPAVLIDGVWCTSPSEQYEWAIFTRSGELHRGPWSEGAARLWLRECTEMGMSPSTFHLCHRSIGPWTRDESVGAMIKREGEEARIKVLEKLMNERQTDV